MTNKDLYLKVGAEYKITEPTKDYILTQVAQVLELPTERILSINRKRELVDARRMFSAITRNETKDSLKKIGKFINRDHSNVVHLLKTHDNIVETDPEYRDKFYKIVHSLNFN